jgi:endonuclease/exonuclease/phosphatase family metal-dependent hydrolase
MSGVRNRWKLGSHRASVRPDPVQFFRILLVPLVALLSGMRSSADEVIRILTGNITSGNFSSYDPGEGNRIFQGLHPDIALIQEMNVGVSPNKNTAATYRAWVTANFGSTFSYYVEPTNAGGDIPNGIVSRYPIIAAGEWDDTTMTNRDYVWAHINIPGDKDLWAVSVHISSGGGASQRNEEAGEIKSYIQTLVPAGDYLVLGGDFNTTSRTEACIGTLSTVVVTTGPFPVDQAGDGDTNNGRGSPYDWVMPDTDLNAVKTTLVIGSNSFPNGLVFDSRVYTPLSAVAPILATDSNSTYPNGSMTNMQHMAVMRAFLIPTNDPPAIASAANSSSTETVTDPDLSVYEIVRGASIGLSVLGTDDAGEAALHYTWSKTAGASSPVTFSANGTNAAKNCTATFQAVGNYTLTATVQDVPGLTVTSSVNVRVVQTAGSLTLNPPTATLAVNATQSFTATVLDQFNQPMASPITWSTNGGGTINPSGVFTATTASGPPPFVVTASSAGFSDTSGVTVTPAFATVSLSNLNQTYDGAPKPVTVGTTPAVQSVSILYAGSSTPPVNAGSYGVVATITDPNYQGSSSGTLVVQKATTVLQLAGLATTYDGSPKPVIVTGTPAVQSVSILYGGSSTPPTSAGSYSVSAVSTDENYTGNISGTLVIQKAAAIVELAGLATIYDGSPKPVTATSTPAVQGVSILYDNSSTPPVNAGSYGVSATVVDPNYQGFASATLIVQKANATIDLTGLATTYDGSPKPVTVTTTPSNLARTVLYGGSETPPVNAGSYAVAVIITDANYQGSASATLVIAADEWALWKNTHFTAPEQAAGLAADGADPDADGFTNLAEYALGANPRQFTAPVTGVMDAGGFSITFTRPANLPGIQYAAEVSGDLTTWSPVPLELVTPGAVETLRARDPFGSAPFGFRCLRLRFERQ